MLLILPVGDRWLNTEEGHKRCRWRTCFGRNQSSNQSCGFGVLYWDYPIVWLERNRSVTVLSIWVSKNYAQFVIFSKFAMSLGLLVILGINKLWGWDCFFLSVHSMKANTLFIVWQSGIKILCPIYSRSENVLNRFGTAGDSWWRTNCVHHRFVSGSVDSPHVPKPSLIREEEEPDSAVGE